MDILSSRRRQVAALLLSVQVGSTMAEDCTNLIGVVLGSIAGTLVVVFIVLLIVYLCHRKSKTGRSHIKQNINGTYDNPTFANDVESGLRHIEFDPKQTGFEGYMVCREYLSRLNTQVCNQIQVQPQSQDQTQVHYSQLLHETPISSKGCSVQSRFAKSSMKKSLNRMNDLNRTGSHASLDNSTTKEAEMVSVFLETRDPNGFGIFIDGNMRDGIFISQVQNRGPAKETGLIHKGDRIINMTISMENMVLEDALTIVSYASPYPVRLLIRKPVAPSRLDTPTPSISLTSNVDDDLVEPKIVNYRSQSLNDLTIIVKDTIIPCSETSSIKGLSPRRARSEIRRPQLKPASYYDISISAAASSSDQYEEDELSQQDQLDLVKLSYEQEEELKVMEQQDRYNHSVDVPHDNTLEVIANTTEDIQVDIEHHSDSFNDVTDSNHQSINLEILATPKSKSILRSSNETAGGVSYFVDIEHQQNFDPPTMNTSGFVVKTALKVDANDNVKGDSQA